MAVKAVNDTTGPDSLVPTLLVFSAYPHIAKLDPPTPSITERAMAIRKAMAEITKLQAYKSVNNALRHRNGPDMTLLHDLLLNSEVLVWQEGNTGQSGKWTGPYTLLALKGETYKLQLPSRPTSFRLTTVKPFLQIETGPETELESDIKEERPIEQPNDRTTLLIVKRRRGRPRKYPLPKDTNTLITDILVFIQELTFENS